MNNYFVLLYIITFHKQYIYHMDDIHHTRSLTIARTWNKNHEDATPEFSNGHTRRQEQLEELSRRRINGIVTVYWKMSLFHGSWINDLQTIMPSVSLFQIKLVGKCWTWVTTTRLLPDLLTWRLLVPNTCVPRGEVGFGNPGAGEPLGDGGGDPQRGWVSSHWEDPGVDEDHFPLGGLFRPT